MPYDSPEKQREYAKKWYKKNKAKHVRNVRKNNKKYFLRNRQFILDYLQSHPCVDCGESDPVVLEFDHRDPGDKRMCVTEAVRLSWSIKTLLVEIDKCDVRCANCHRRKTAKDFGYFRAQ